MDFLEIAQNRQSCRSYDAQREVEQEKLDAVLEAVRLAVTLGYAKDEPLRKKMRKERKKLVGFKGETGAEGDT